MYDFYAELDLIDAVHQNFEFLSKALVINDFLGLGRRTPSRVVGLKLKPFKNLADGATCIHIIFKRIPLETN